MNLTLLWYYSAAMWYSTLQFQCEGTFSAVDIMVFTPVVGVTTGMKLLTMNTFFCTGSNNWIWKRTNVTYKTAKLLNVINFMLYLFLLVSSLYCMQVSLQNQAGYWLLRDPHRLLWKHYRQHYNRRNLAPENPWLRLRNSWCINTSFKSCCSLTLWKAGHLFFPSDVSTLQINQITLVILQ